MVAARQDKQAKIKAETLKARTEAEKKNEDEKQIADFFTKLSHSDDLHDNLEELTHFLAHHTGATGVYIGKLVFPIKPIDDDAAENDHLDEEAPKVIRYLYATPDHKFLIDRTLKPDEGITHDVFKESSQG